MINLPSKAEVHCSDGVAGRSTYVIGNPLNRQITHLVVKSYLPPFQEYLVPVDQVEQTTNERITLKCSRNDLNHMELFIIETYTRTELPGYLHWPGVPPAAGSRPEPHWYHSAPPMEHGSCIYWSDPFPSRGSVSEKGEAYKPVQRRNLPSGELALRRGARVEATDGYVGQVDGLLINPSNMQVTHLVLLERHRFQKREITVPVSQIDHMDEGTVYLKLDRQSVEALPATPVQRGGLPQGGANTPADGD